MVGLKNFSYFPREHLTRIWIEADFLPMHFAAPESAVYPCVLKPCQGEFGKNSYICNSKDEVHLEALKRGNLIAHRTTGESPQT